MTSILIGNFDGVHRGHQALIAKARDLCPGGLNVLTFAPHPRRYFQPDAPAFCIVNAGMKQERLKAHGIHDVITLPFDNALAALTAHAFIDQYLREQLQAKTVIVGDDFCFGKGRTGTVKTLQDQTAFVTHSIPLLHHQDCIVSSSQIRQHIRAGDIAAANALLGWDWFIDAVVEKGDQRGRELGYPTANIQFGDIIVPSYGVYAVKVKVAGVSYNGVANIGVRPMFALQTPLLEAHLFDFQGDLYGQSIQVYPIKKLRDEAYFDDLDGLIQQMDKDSVNARLALGLPID